MYLALTVCWFSILAGIAWRRIRMANISDKGHIKVEKAECFVVNP